MKKYIVPQMEVIEVEAAGNLLSVSNPLNQFDPLQGEQDIMPSTDPIDIMNGELFG